MKMTIAEPIQTLEYLRDSGVFPFDTKEGVLYTVESIDVAISTMRKFQKIEQIVKTWREMGLDYDSCDAMEDIERVLKNGNDD